MSPTSPETAVEAAWFCSLDVQLAHFELDDETVVFDRRSGYTHILDPIASLVLSLTRERPRTQPELLRLAREAIECEDGVDLVSHVDQALGQLAALDLVTRAPR
ncbi:MAG: HPr-rel-A system PqqD family peptide chaperone [Gammaproteobacteria bacterium]|jgi:PqqD family protein of HPr-rel-A system|nr:HPr-rel-A system PqqD family peptide chaperone [Gammaproteobacteria bacterium]